MLVRQRLEYAFALGHADLSLLFSSGMCLLHGRMTATAQTGISQVWRPEAVPAGSWGQTAMARLAGAGGVGPPAGLRRQGRLMVGLSQGLTGARQE